MILDKTRVRICHGDERRNLPPMEFAILERLERAKGGFVSTDQLIMTMYPDDNEPEFGNIALRVQISHLRSKMRAIGAPEVIEARRGFGYRFGDAA